MQRGWHQSEQLRPRAVVHGNAKRRRSAIEDIGATADAEYRPMTNLGKSLRPKAAAICCPQIKLASIAADALSDREVRVPLRLSEDHGRFALNAEIDLGTPVRRALLWMRNPPPKPDRHDARLREPKSYEQGGC